MSFLALSDLYSLSSVMRWSKEEEGERNMDALRLFSISFKDAYLHYFGEAPVKLVENKLTQRTPGCFSHLLMRLVENVWTVIIVIKSTRSLSPSSSEPQHSILLRAFSSQHPHNNLNNTVF